MRSNCTCDTCGPWKVSLANGSPTTFFCARSLNRSTNCVVDGFLHVDTRAGAAALAVVEEDAEVDPRDGVVDVGVLEDDVGRLAAEFEGDLLQVGAGGGLEDGAASDGRASEGDLVNVHVRGDGGTSSLAETGQDVDDTWWETDLLGEVGGDETAEWGLLGSLDDDDVAGGDGRADLPCPHEQWEVPWDDLTADTDGLLLDVVEGVGGGVGDTALDLVRPAAVVSQAAGAHADVDLSHVLGLAVVERLNGGEEVEVFLERLGELDEELATVLWGLLSPWALERLAGCRYGNVDILLSGLVHLGDDLLGRRVVCRELLAIDGLHPLVVDEAIGLQLAVFIGLN